MARQEQDKMYVIYVCDLTIIPSWFIRFFLGFFYLTTEKNTPKGQSFSKSSGFLKSLQKTGPLLSFRREMGHYSNLQ